MRKVLLAVLLSAPSKRTNPPPSSAPEASTGKFCRLLAPLSASPTSLAVTPAAPMSMPSWAFEWIVLPSTALPTPASA